MQGISLINRWINNRVRHLARLIWECPALSRWFLSWSTLFIIWMSASLLLPSASALFTVFLSQWLVLSLLLFLVFWIFSLLAHAAVIFIYSNLHRASIYVAFICHWNQLDTPAYSIYICIAKRINSACHLQRHTVEVSENRMMRPAA